MGKSNKVKCCPYLLFVLCACILVAVGLTCLLLFVKKPYPTHFRCSHRNPRKLIESTSFTNEILDSSSTFSPVTIYSSIQPETTSQATTEQDITIPTTMSQMLIDLSSLMDKNFEEPIVRSDMYDTWKPFVKNFETNIISTGVPEVINTTQMFKVPLETTTTQLPIETTITSITAATLSTTLPPIVIVTTTTLTTTEPSTFASTTTLPPVENSTEDKGEVIRLRILKPLAASTISPVNSNFTELFKEVYINASTSVSNPHLIKMLAQFFEPDTQQKNSVLSCIDNLSIVLDNAINKGVELLKNKPMLEDLKMLVKEALLEMTKLITKTDMAGDVSVIAASDGRLNIEAVHFTPFQMRVTFSSPEELVIISESEEKTLSKPLSPIPGLKMKEVFKIHKYDVNKEEY